MLIGDGGAVLLNGLTLGSIRAWEMRPGGDGVSLTITPALAPYWSKALAEVPLDALATLRVRLKRSANPDYDLTFTGDVAECISTRIVLHHAKECST